MIGAPDRRNTIELIEEAMANGATQAKACEALGLSARTYQRWTREGGVETDGRPGAKRAAPANKLSVAEREQILDICNCPPYASLPPSQIVPALADQGVYLASESSFYRVGTLQSNCPAGARREFGGKCKSPRPIGRTVRIRCGVGTSPTVRPVLGNAWKRYPSLSMSGMHSMRARKAQHE